MLTFKRMIFLGKRMNGLKIWLLGYFYQCIQNCVESTKKYFLANQIYLQITYKKLIQTPTQFKSELIEVTSLIIYFYQFLQLYSIEVSITGQLLSTNTEDKIISQYSTQSTQLVIIKINIKIFGIMNRLALIKTAISKNITLENLTELKLTKEENIATIWFNAPSSLNAVSNRMIDQFRFLLPHLDNDDSVKIIAIRSSHQKVFCAGADIKDFLVNYESNRQNAVRPLNLGKTFRSVRKVLVAVVQGAALGGGFQIALHCDIILCSEKATFGLPEINLGLIPALGGTQNLSKIVGTKVASRLILTGETLNATQAHRLNIAHLIQGDNFEEKVKQFFNNLSNKALDSLQAGKKAIKLSLDTTLQQGLQHETTIFQALFNKKGPKEGISAFVQKRKPNFKNI